MAQIETGNEALLPDCPGKAEISAKDNTKRDIISEISHDIRTPISGIMGMTRIALNNADNPERVTDCLYKIGSSAQYLLSLVNNVLNISRLDAGKVNINHEPFNIRSMAEICCSVIQGQLVGKKPKLICEYSNIVHSSLVGDSVHLSQIIIDILGNSVKFTDEGEIRFRITELSDYGNNALFRFEFEDTGIGMSEDYLPWIFEPFSQDKGQDLSRHQGTGLGMAIVKKYVEMMSGSISVESKLNYGTKFVIEVPIEIDKNPTEDKTKIHSSIRLDGERILLAEDNELNAEITAGILQETGADVIIANNGKIAVDLYSQSEESYFDLILMDVIMPRMDGITAAKEIRKLDRADAAKVPIIAMTADAFDKDKQNALDAGMNAYLTKPIDADALMNILEKVI
jgi:CheY-like chemotaxis protein